MKGSEKMADHAKWGHAKKRRFRLLKSRNGFKLGRVPKWNCRGEFQILLCRIARIFGAY